MLWCTPSMKELAMRLATCRYHGDTRVGIVNGDVVSLVPTSAPWPRGMLELIEAGPATWEQLGLASKQFSEHAPLSEVTLLAPVPRPRKNILCLGLNYLDHARESLGTFDVADKLPTHPIVFTKNTTSINAPGGDIPVDPDVTSQLDWEVELGVVIGRGGRKIPEARALEHVFGYTVINDVSARDLQARHKQYFIGKSLDGACPMGPTIVTADEIPDPQRLDLRTWVNGQLKQSSNTREQIFSVARTISILSRGMTLEPGDIISTGTPAGVGFARQPPEFLQPGDVVECEVEGIGRLRNTCRAA
jgi:2-keto-4-pentenoate hydratase/2-oxohepta-3-ene-1,7-dioic acid hydratase in catechol pathway